MKHKSILRTLAVAALIGTLCCTGMTAPAISADETEELPARIDLREVNPSILTDEDTYFYHNEKRDS